MTFRYFMWVEGRAFRITKRLHVALVEGAVRLPQFANSSQRIIEVAVFKSQSQATQIELTGSTYVFDDAGKLDMVDQVEAVRGLLGFAVKGNVIGIDDVLAHQQWRREHAWSPPQDAITQVLMDILPEQRPDNFKGLPVLKGVR